MRPVCTWQKMYCAGHTHVLQTQHILPVVKDPLQGLTAESPILSFMHPLIECLSLALEVVEATSVGGAAATATTAAASTTSAAK